MKISRAQEKDMEDVIEMMMNADNRNKEWSEQRAKSFIYKKKDKLILIAKNNKKLIGYLGIKKYDDNPGKNFADINKNIWITWIAILPEYRSKGVGSILLKSADKYIKRFNKKGILLDCRKKLIPFYKKNGYSKLGKYRNKRIVRYVMGKELK